MNKKGITEKEIKEFIKVLKTVQKRLEESKDKRKGEYYKELKKLFHSGDYWNVKLFDEWAKSKGIEENDIAAMMLNISHHKVDKTFYKRIVKKYRIKRIKKNTPKMDETKSLIKHFFHFKNTTNWTEKEIIAFIKEHFHKSLSIKQISSRIKYYKSVGKINLD